MPKPTIGISACLLGDLVRHNGGHKRHVWIDQELNQWVKWHRVCPEVEMGLGVPRESIRLQIKKRGAPVKLYGVRSDQDHTTNAKQTAGRILKKLPQNLDGFILKKSSPSCGLERVRVYDWNESCDYSGMGIFAQTLVKAYPELPVIEEGRLFNPKYRELFLTQVWAHHEFSRLPTQVAALQKFHQSYKFLIQAHSEATMRKLGNLAANSKKNKPTLVFSQYKKLFFSAFKNPATTRHRVNVAEHIWGFVRDKATSQEKKGFLKNVADFKKGKIPYIALMTVIQHMIDKYGEAYIKNQKIFLPYPEEISIQSYLEG